VLRWAANQVGAGARVLAVKGLRAGAGPWRLRIDRGGTPLEVVLRVGDPSSRQRLAALLMTALAGSSTIPVIASVARLRALGAAAATLHAVAAAPRPDLPLRVRPLADVDFAAKRRASGSSPLLEAAAERVNQVPILRAKTGLVHGDLW
jgi:Ser/Thr protein kinase RdoA (MazF antagonist)